MVGSEDVDAAFEKALESSREFCTKNNLRNAGRKSANRKRVLVVNASGVDSGQRVARHISKDRRQMSLVDRQLVQVFRDLCGGRLAWPLFLHGPPDTGKTSAALALADFCLASYWHFEALVDDIIKGDPWPLVRSADLAILDEFGARENIADVHYTALLRFWEEREERGGVAIYISNASPSQLAGVYDDRITSRILCGTIFETKGRRNG